MQPQKTSRLNAITVFITIFFVGILTYISFFKLCEKRLPYNFTLPFYRSSAEAIGLILDLTIQNDVSVDGPLISVLTDESSDDPIVIPIVMTGRVIEDISMLISLFFTGLLTVWFLRFQLWIQVLSTFVCFTTGVFLLFLHRLVYAYVTILTQSIEKGVFFYRHAWPANIVIAIVISFFVMLLLKNLFYESDESDQKIKRKYLPNPLTINMKPLFIIAGIIIAIQFILLLITSILSYNRY